MGLVIKNWGAFGAKADLNVISSPSFLFRRVGHRADRCKVLPAISNLSVLSKLLERVACQLMEHLNAARLLPDLLSAYGAYHSTETTVVKVLTDILRALDTGDLALLTLLDWSPTFDMVDHATLLRRLKVSYGLHGHVLGWFQSYLDGRMKFVRCGQPLPPSPFFVWSSTGIGSWTHPVRAVYCSWSTDANSADICTLTTRRYTADPAIHQQHRSSRSMYLPVSTT